MAEGHEDHQHWEQHTHEALVHSHRHYHVTHNHNRIAGGFDHLSSEHEHEHDHAEVTHTHYPHADFEKEHRGEAHDHDHAAPVKGGGAKKAAGKKAARRAWVEPDDGMCPPSHPVKAKLSSRLFHLPGMAFYNRTRADRCYADEESAVQDGLTRAKR